MRRWIGALDLPVIILACQDGGSLIGLRLVAEMPERFAGVALSNGGLPERQPAPRAFAIWRAFSRHSPAFPLGRIVNAGAKRTLSAAEIAASDAPFPTRAATAAARIVPGRQEARRLGEGYVRPCRSRWRTRRSHTKPTTT